MVDSTGTIKVVSHGSACLLLLESVYGVDPKDYRRRCRMRWHELPGEKNRVMVSDAVAMRMTIEAEELGKIRSKEINIRSDESQVRRLDGFFGSEPTIVTVAWGGKGDDGK